MKPKSLHIPWSKDSYLLIPGAVYRSNRFPVAERHELATEQARFPGELLVDPTVGSLHDPESTLDITLSRCAAPFLAAWSRPENEIVWIELPRDALHAGFLIREREDRNTLFIEVHHPLRRKFRRSPGREPVREPDAEKPDLPEIPVTITRTPCPDLHLFFRQVRDRILNRIAAHPLPESPSTSGQLWTLCEDKMNRDNWNEKEGYYHSFLAHGKRFDPDVGWTGGIQALEPLWRRGSEQTRSRVKRDLMTFIRNGQSACGLFYSKRTPDGCISEPDNGEHLLRRTGDALNTLLALLPDLPELEPACRRAADALAQIFSHTDVSPHYVDQETGDIRVHGGTGAASAVAALARASAVWSDPDLCSTALHAGELLWTPWVSNGLFGGGPNDACQTPDSESIYFCIGAFLNLHDLEPKGSWLERAVTAANLYSTWVTCDPVPFPEGSTFERLDMPTVGTVWANLRNPHAAPGICTASTRDLRRLANVSGDESWIRLADAIDAALPWYLSTTERPITAHPGGQILPPGWMGETVYFNDHNAPYDHPFASPPGEPFLGSCWGETSLMLTLQDQE